MFDGMKIGVIIISLIRKKQGKVVIILINFTRIEKRKMKPEKLR